MPTETPQGWSRLTIEDLVESHFNGPSPDCDEREVQNSNEWGVLKTTAITWDKGWDWKKHKVLPCKYWGLNRCEVRNGDVLITKAGPRHRVGVVASVDWTPGQIIASGKMIGLRPHQKEVMPRILASALATHDAQRFLDHRTTGMAESQVNFANEVLLQLSVTIPPMEEQRHMTRILDCLDETIRKTEQVFDKLQIAKQGLQHDLLTRGIDDNGALRDPDCHPEQFKDSILGKIPVGWHVSTLGREFTLQRGFDITVAAQREGTVPVVSSSGITSFHDSAMVDGPGVVTGRKGNLGNTYYIDSAYWPHDTTLWVKDFHGNSPKFAALFLKIFRLERFDAATSVPTLNRNVVHPVSIAIPPLGEQEMIVALVDESDTGTQAVNAFLNKLVSIKAGLMDDLLTGRVRVPLDKVTTV
jgi:type I restriction enzyme S subunit